MLTNVRVPEPQREEVACEPMDYACNFCSKPSRQRVTLLRYRHAGFVLRVRPYAVSQPQAHWLFRHGQDLKLSFRVQGDVGKGNVTAGFVSTSVKKRFN